MKSALSVLIESTIAVRMEVTALEIVLKNFLQKLYTNYKKMSVFFYSKKKVTSKNARILLKGI